MTTDVTYHQLADLPWEDPRDAPPELKDLADEAAEVGARRAQVTTGAIALHSQISELPAGYRIPPHSHTAHELMIVLHGSCQVDDGPELTATNIVIATGARPRSLPGLEIDGESVITSRQALEMRETPSAIGIVGGGAIGVEFAYYFRAYGAEVVV